MNLSCTIHLRTFIKKVVAKNVSYKTDVSCDIGDTSQRIIQTKKEDDIRFWVPNLGLSPKYD